MKTRAYLLFVVLGILWGSLWLLTGSSPNPMPLLCEGALRFGAAALVLAIYAAARKTRNTAAQRFSFASGIVIGLVLLAVPYACTAWASGAVHPYLKATAAGLPAAMYAATPLVVMLMLREDAGQYLTRLMLGLIGAALLVVQGVALDALRWPAESVLAAGMLVYGFSLVFASGRLRNDFKGGQSFGIIGWCALQFATAAVVLAIVAAGNGDWARLAENAPVVEPIQWAGVVLAAGVSSVTLPLFYRLLKELGPIPAAALQWLVTLTSVIELGIFFSATWIWENWVGLLFATGALWWVLQRGRNSEETLLAR